MCDTVTLQCGDLEREDSGSSGLSLARALESAGMASLFDTPESASPVVVRRHSCVSVSDAPAPTQCPAVLYCRVLL